VLVPPTFSGISPGSGGAGTAVTVYGAHFTGATAVTLNGATAQFSVVSDSQLTVTVPAGATSGPIAVTTPSGSATSSSTFTVAAPLTSLSFSPGAAPAGAPVTISGAHFTGATSVRFNGVPASFTVNSDSQITAIVPSFATSGAVTVTTPAGTVTSTTSFFVFR
jgi:predicted extracellular nuclease